MISAAAHGRSMSLAGLKELGEIYVIQRRDSAELDLIHQALAWAEQEAWKHKHLKVTDGDLKKHMKRALHGDKLALSRLEGLALGTQASAREAEVVFRFVQAKLSKSDT